MAKQKITILKKISTKTVCGDIAPSKILKEGTPLYRVYGIVRGIKTGQTQYGEFTGFRGDFRAQNVETKEAFAGAVCYLPPVAQDLVLGAFDMNTRQPLNFAFEIGIKENLKVPMKYEYTCEPLMKPQESDIMRQIESEIAS